MTPLHWASQNGHPEVVKILLQSQADVNVKSKVSTAIFILFIPYNTDNSDCELNVYAYSCLRGESIYLS